MNKTILSKILSVFLALTITFSNSFLAFAQAVPPAPSGGESKIFYFHNQTAALTNSHVLSTTAPTLGNSQVSSINSTNTPSFRHFHPGKVNHQHIFPSTEPSHAPPVDSASWISETPLNGSFQAGSWKFVIHKDDNTGGEFSKPHINVYSSPSNTSLTDAVFLFDIEGPDWWNNNDEQLSFAASQSQFEFNNAYLVVQIFDHCIADCNAGKTLLIFEDGQTSAAQTRIESSLFVSASEPTPPTPTPPVDDTPSTPPAPTDTVAPIITMLGDNPVSVFVGETYTDAGATAADNVDPEVTVNVVNSVNTSVIGAYTVVYTAADTAGNSAAPVIRTVNVIAVPLPPEPPPPPADVTAPVITLNGENPVEIVQNTVYIDAGATAADNVDTAVEVNSVSTVNTAVIGEYTVTYTAIDSAGNAAIPVIRTVNVIVAPLPPAPVPPADTIAPVITLNGTSPVEVIRNTVYVDAGATAIDNVDGDITASIITTGLPINTSAVGTFTITYNVSDAAGNTATQVIRTINVAAEAPVLNTINVVPVLPIINVGAVQAFSAATLDQFGNPIAAAVSWTSSDPLVGTIDSATGVFTPLKGGITTITATSGAVSGSTTVTVQPVLAVINVSPAAPAINVGAVQAFSAAALDQFGNPIAAAVTWTSSNIAVGLINSSTGSFTALSEGVTIITAVSAEVTGSTAVTVNAIPAPEPLPTPLPIPEPAPLPSPANTPPVIAPIPNLSITLGTPVSFTVAATDADSDILTFSLGNDAPEGATIDPVSGVFSWTPTIAGAFTFDILVSDGVNAPVATGRLIESRNLGGGMATWAEVKAQAKNMLGILLDDLDVLDLPLLAVDAYGNFLKGVSGFPQLVMPGLSPADSPILVEGNPLSPVDATGAIRSGHPFLADIAHDANPVNTRGVPLKPDSDSVIGLSEPGTYDNELLDAHFIAGDGRVNENIGLTSVHHIFHSEHNRLVEYTKNVILDTGDLEFLTQWLMPGTVPAVFPITQEAINGLSWNGERLFQAAKFGTEMQYQHLVFEEFARKIQPQVNVFSGYHTDIDPAIAAEFAHTVYRFGHTMLTDTIARTNPDGTSNDIGLIQAFLNPLEFLESGTTPDAAAGAIAAGMIGQVGSEIDEFVTESLRNNLLGLPLDLATINLARGRDTGIPSLNSARAQFFLATAGDPALKPYGSWVEFKLGIRHPESLINFIAAYGTHTAITDAVTLADKRAAATLLVLGGEGAPEDRLDFLNSTGAWASTDKGIITGVNDVDFWIGGLAEKQMPFGGLLGSTFNFVFETQMEKLQDGDRLYYLSRNAGLNFLTQLEQNSFAELAMRNTSGIKHPPHDIFSHPAFNIEAADIDPLDPSTLPSDTIIMPDGTIRYTGIEHIVMGGTEGNDKMRSSEGDDTLWGDGGNDRLEGGEGNDFIIGGTGDDILTDIFGDDNIKGGEGNDVINAGSGIDLILGGSGHDFVVGGRDPKEIFGGEGNDFILAGDAADTVFGNEGDDWIEGGAQADLLQGDNGNPFQNSSTIGNDVIIGGGGDDDYDSESGDDIMLSDPGIERNEGMQGFDWVTYKNDPQPANADMFFKGLMLPEVDTLRDRFDSVEGLSGGQFNDILRGDNLGSIELSKIDGNSGQNNSLNNAGQIALIDGLQSLLGDDITSFSGGNIILGGGGNDIIEGRGGNDLIDGDAWLNARLSVRDSNDPGIEILTADSMTELQEAIFEGKINPGQIRIIREILVSGTAENDIDTAVFSGNFADYTISLPDAQGRITVTDNRADNGGKENNGIDTIRNIEKLQFADQTIDLEHGLNKVESPKLKGILAISAGSSFLGGSGLTLIRSDLQFILDQIRIAEAHAAGTPLLNLIPKDTLPWGLRTIDGSWNNIVPGQSSFGAADRIFPRLTTPIFREGEIVSIDLDGPGPLKVGDLTSYAQTNGFVFDSKPRLISNLIVDQTPSNPAAVAAAGELTLPDPFAGTLFIPNVAPDMGLSASFNSWFILFGQFFDHGLDLVNKGKSGTVFVPLMPDDPLFNPLSHSNFMVLTRATNLPGPDGIMGTSDDIREHINQTSPFVDQNQTYTSHPSHQVFLRAYSFGPAKRISPIAAAITVTAPLDVVVPDEDKKGAISGIVFQDANINRVKDVNELALSGWTIFLDANDNSILDTGEFSTVTDAFGNYQFSDLIPGSYNVREILQSNWELSTPRGGNGKHAVTISGGDQIEGLSFGNAVFKSIDGQGKFAPLNGETITSKVISLGTSVVNVTVNGGTSFVTVPDGTEITKIDGSNLDIAALTAIEPTSDSITGVGEGIVVNGKLQWGIPNHGLSFSNPITLNIFVGTALNGQTLSVLRSRTGTDNWTNDGILPPHKCVVADGTCTFQATKASYYIATTQTVAPVVVTAAPTPTPTLSSASSNTTSTVTANGEGNSNTISDLADDNLITQLDQIGQNEKEVLGATQEKETPQGKTQTAKGFPAKNIMLILIVLMITSVLVLNRELFYRKLHKLNF